MHRREARKSIAITKQISQTCSLTQHHYRKRPLSLKIPAAAIRLLNTGNTVSVTLFVFCRFANIASVPDVHQYSRRNCSYPHTTSSRPDFQQQGRQPSPAPAGSIHCVPHVGGRPAGDRSPQCQHCVTQGCGRACKHPDESFPDALCYQPAAGMMPGPNT